MTNNEYFTEKERDTILSALHTISDIGISIFDNDTKEDLTRKPEITDRETFFVKAKLWHVISTIITSLFIEKLNDKELFLRDRKGNVYTIMPSMVGQKMEEVE
jgi:hypothetical protein